MAVAMVGEACTG